MLENLEIEAEDAEGAHEEGMERGNDSGHVLEADLKELGHSSRSRHIKHNVWIDIPEVFQTTYKRFLIHYKNQKKYL